MADPIPAPDAAAGEPASAVRARSAPRRTRPDPDAEAAAIALRVIEKAAVARSLARIFGGLARAHVGAAATVVRGFVDQKVAEAIERDADTVAAAAAAAAHVQRASGVARAVVASARHAARAAAVRAAARLEDDDGG